jgi:flagellum-specific peptidoglycan hydrolase FlgJ
MNAKEMLFLRSVVPAAQASMRSSGVPASITIAQAILESGWGCSELSEQADNYFGIKASHLGDPESYIAMPTAEYVNGVRVMELADFEKYPTAADCFADHAALLSQAQRYAPAMAVKADPQAFAAELERCGYSTSPTYASSLMELVREFDLTQYDVPAAKA